MFSKALDRIQKLSLINSMEQVVPTLVIEVLIQELILINKHLTIMMMIQTLLKPLVLLSNKCSLLIPSQKITQVHKPSLKQMTISRLKKAVQKVFEETLSSLEMLIALTLVSGNLQINQSLQRAQLSDKEEYVNRSSAEQVKVRLLLQTSTRTI